MPSLKDLAEAVGIVFTLNEDASEIAHRDYSDGRTAVIMQMTFGKGRVAIGPTGSYWFDDAW